MKSIILRVSSLSKTALTLKAKRKDFYLGLLLLGIHLGTALMWSFRLELTIAITTSALREIRAWTLRSISVYNAGVFLKNEPPNRVSF